MKLGTVTSCVGDMAVVLPPEDRPAVKLDEARRLLGKPASLEKKSVGRVFDVIGNVNKPYFVVRLNRGSLSHENLLGKELHAK